ncbi:MAG TPA: Wzy polymerase domain-containing protein [Ideonella sp.]|uniref:PglL family O-oligosaccharyltransferase n=1 Tax=Ideonella sp. TaxID=1929293 RepID=UPI002E374796|nr:Wzy polymerase domain-containing protein [Ideonella sp.]HEX5687651.1 Wzy polymerase domain-containing protein [Ideonella sp.]
MPFYVALAFALIAPTLLAYNASPSATLMNQLLAVGLWGAAIVAAPRSPRLDGPLAGPLQGTLLLMGLTACVVHWLDGLPSSLALSMAALIGAALLVTTFAVLRPVAAPAEHSAMPAFQAVLLAAGLASTGIAVIQVFAPALADGTFIAASGLPGRAVGNLRQPNHLSSLLLWALIAWVPLAQAGRVAAWQVDRRVALLLGALLLWAVVLTASRTGIVGVILLALWGLVDRRLARWVRAALVSAPVAYLLIALAMAGWAHATGHTFGGEERLAEGDVSSSRFGIWANTLTLIRQQPWTGVGFGEFNFAWTLTPFPDRPVAFFDHTHNLPLQLWVELGIPLGSLVLGLLLWALVQAGVRSWRVPGEEGAGSRAAFMMVLMIGVHSLFEYPLWYAYFLLPTAWAWGYALRTPEPAKPKHELPATRFGAPVVMRLAGVLMVAGSLFALYDYWKVVAIYAPTDDAGPLSERIERGQGSVFFSHHADYAAATTTNPPSAAMAAFNTTTHSLLDTRLMLAWAQALAESGHRDKASYLAARLREFRNPASADFFAVCNDPAKMATSPPPFQCVPPPAGLTWRDFQTRTE